MRSWPPDMTVMTPEEPGEGRIRERCVLCVDDDHEFLKSLEFFLPEQINRSGDRGLSYRFVFLSDPIEGLEVLRELVAGGETVAMLITDQQMPHMKGTEFLAQTRDLAPNSMRILLTGHAGIEAAITAINDQLLDRYLTKPIEVEHDFTLSVRHLLERFEMQLRLRDQDALIGGLYDFANTLQAAEDVDSTLRITADFTKSAVGCDEVQIVLRAAAAPQAARTPAPAGARPGDAPSSAAAPDRRPADTGIVARAEDCPGYSLLAPASAGNWPAGAVAYAVLEARGGIIGLLLAWESPEGTPFTEDTLARLRYIAAGASIALQNQLGRLQLEDIARTRSRHLEEARGRLGILDQLKSDFLAFVCHEIRTPLNQMAAIDLIDGNLNERDHEKMVGAVRSGYERFERFIMSSLEYFEWFSAKPEMCEELTDLAHLVRTAAAGIEAHDEARVDLTVPTPDFACLVRFPRACAEKLLAILFDNAVKFSNGPPRIRVGLGSSPGWATLTVSDQGRGFPPEWAPEIFRPFTIADPMHHHQGTALSLAKAAAMVEAYNGRIRAESAGMHHGATFTVELPLMAEEHGRVLDFGTRKSACDDATAGSASDPDPHTDYPMREAA